MVQKAFRQEGYEYVDKAIEGVLKKLKQESLSDLLAEVGRGNITAREVVLAVFPGVKQPSRTPSFLNPDRFRARPGKAKPPRTLPSRSRA